MYRIVFLSPPLLPSFSADACFWKIWRYKMLRKINKRKSHFGVAIKFPPLNLIWQTSFNYTIKQNACHYEKKIWRSETEREREREHFGSHHPWHISAHRCSVKHSIDGMGKKNKRHENCINIIHRAFYIAPWIINFNFWLFPCAFHVHIIWIATARINFHFWLVHFPCVHCRINDLIGNLRGKVEHTPKKKQYSASIII